MAKDSFNKTADWAPGTLDKTRKAIGDIDPKEAATLAKKLGGQVLNERTEHADSPIQNTPRAKRPSAPPPRTPRNPSSSSSGSRLKTSVSSASFHTPVKHRRKNDLQTLPPKLCAEIDKLMMSSEYQIKANYGLSLIHI